MKYAEVWADLLYRLRDGETGELVRVKGKQRPIPVATVIVANRVATRKLMKTLEGLRGQDGILWLRSPIYPEQEIWEGLKHASSTEQIRVALAKIERCLRNRWKLSSYYSPDEDELLIGKRVGWTKTIGSQLLLATRKNADEIIKAKNLPHYPRAERPSSDNKRIEFFAKVFAGFALGLAPLTATKRLSRWKRLKRGAEQKPISDLQEAAAKRKEHTRQRP